MNLQAAIAPDLQSLVLAAGIFKLEVEVGFEPTPVKARGVADRGLKPLDYSTISSWVEEWRTTP